MFRIAKAFVVSALVVLISSAANASVVNFSLATVGDQMAYTHVDTAAGTFMDDYVLTVDNSTDLKVSAAVEDMSTAPMQGFSNLMVQIIGAGPAVGALPAFVTATLLASGSPYTIRVTGDADAAGGIYKLTATAVGHAPIPGAALLFGTGLLVLAGSARRKHFFGRMMGRA